MVENIKTNVVFLKMLDPRTTKERKIYSDLCERFPTTSSRGNKYIYVMYMYDCNAILTTVMKNISDKEMIRAFTSLTEYLKICGINPGFHFMDNEASTTLKMKINSMKIKYQLVPPNNHRVNNAKRVIQKFKNHFIAGLRRVDKEFHLQLWDRLLQQENQSKFYQATKNSYPHISLYFHIQII